MTCFLKYTIILIYINKIHFNETRKILSSMIDKIKLKNFYCFVYFHNHKNSIAQKIKFLLSNQIIKYSNYKKLCEKKSHKLHIIKSFKKIKVGSKNIYTRIVNLHIYSHIHNLSYNIIIHYRILFIFWMLLYNFSKILCWC